MEASNCLLEAKTSEAENLEGQRRVRVKSVGSEEPSLQRPSRGPHCSPPLCHLVVERWLASTVWLALEGLQEGC